MFQDALNSLGADVAVDGVLRQKTVEASKGYAPRRVLTATLVERLRFSRELETYKTFGFGWDKRIIKVAISS